MKGMPIITRKGKVPKPCSILSDSLQPLPKEGFENDPCPVLGPPFGVEQRPELMKDRKDEKTVKTQAARWLPPGSPQKPLRETPSSPLTRAPVGAVGPGSGDTPRGAACTDKRMPSPGAGPPFPSLLATTRPPAGKPPDVPTAGRGSFRVPEVTQNSGVSINEGLEIARLGTPLRPHPGLFCSFSRTRNETCSVCFHAANVLNGRSFCAVSRSHAFAPPSSRGRRELCPLRQRR